MIVRQSVWVSMALCFYAAGAFAAGTASTDADGVVAWSSATSARMSAASSSRRDGACTMSQRNWNRRRSGR